MYLAKENDHGRNHPYQDILSTFRKKERVGTHRRWVTLWRLALSKKPGQPNFGIITTAIYVKKCGSVAKACSWE
jgi:hypothetical protein